MSYLVATELSGEQAGNRFRKLLERPQILQLPGAYNGLSALQAKAAKFEALYLSGAAMSASMGLPDLGILTVNDVCFFVRQVARASQLPILVDGDTGFGGVLNVMHMVRSFEDAGAAAVQIEDQLLPKKCGHLNDKKLVEPNDMAAKIAAAVRARHHLYVVARTDAVESEGVRGAIKRAQLYVEAGADAIFPEALADVQSFRMFADAIKVPLVANMTEFGRTPPMTANELEALGYKVVLWPVSALRMAAKAHAEVYECMRESGGTQRVIDRMQTRKDLYETIDYYRYEVLDKSLLPSQLPDAPQDI
jgi:methylisocitrate lyase